MRPWTTRPAGIALAMLSLALASARLRGEGLPEHKVMDGLATSRIVPGAPYDLAGKRMVFTNWYYIQPGDLDWRNDAGKSVYVDGDEGPFAAHHIAINAPRGIRLVAETPQVVGPRDRPHRMIIQEGAIYKGWTDSDYYESTDGQRWEKKAALVFEPKLRDGLYQVFRDPSAPASERYKGLWTDVISRAQFDAFRARRPDGWEPRSTLHLAEKGEAACLRGGVSPDGIHWKALADPIVVEYSDTWNTGYFDTTLGEYVLFTRAWSVGPRTGSLPPDIRNSWTGVGRRAIGRAASRDFSRFAPSEMILETTPEMLPSEQLYTNCYTTIPGAPDQHLMFPTIWNGSIDDTTRVVMATSHDGKIWHWAPGGTLLQTQAFGAWNGGCVWATPNLIELPNGDWALPYLAHNFPHKYPRGQAKGGTGYAIWPKGRLMAVASENQGEFTTLSIIAPGKTLKVNAVTGRTGWVKIEVLGAKKHAMDDCIPIIGDQHWTRVAWKDGADLGEPGRAVTLRIQMKQAKLYGLEFE